MTPDADLFDDIPGTVHFNGERLRQGYQLNKFLLSLLRSDARKAFKADQGGYLATFSMSQEQRDAVLGRDWSRMVELGANIFAIVKLANCDGVPMPHINAIMTGMSNKDYENMMNAGGRPMDGIRSKRER